MIVFAALDLRAGRTVQLVGGAPDAERVSLDDPPRVAAEWAAWGFPALHVVDLDAALGDGDNDGVIREVLRETRLPTQVGGGVRSADRIEALLALGASRVVVGTRAIEDAAWLTEMAYAFPGRLVVAADARDGIVVTRGWTRRTAIQVGDFVDGLTHVPIAGVLVTDVSREGAMGGADVRFFRELRGRSAHSIIASGGIRDGDDLLRLRDAGLDGAVVGMALYTGALERADIERINS